MSIHRAGNNSSGPVRPENEEAALQVVAKQGWAYSERSTTLASDMEITRIFKRVNEPTPIANLHWSLGHVNLSLEFMLTHCENQE